MYTLPEAKAMRFALFCAQEENRIYVICESDALSLISKLQSGSKGLAPSNLVLDDIQNLASYFSSLLSNHVKSLGNTIAYLIARLPSDVGDVQFVKIKLSYQHLYSCKVRHESNQKYLPHSPSKKKNRDVGSTSGMPHCLQWF